MHEGRGIKLGIIDADPLFRQGVAATFGADLRFCVVATGANDLDAIEIARARQPDIMLVDRTAPGCGLTLVAQLKQIRPEVKIVLLTGSENEDHISEAFRAGAHGYVLKRVSGPDLSRTLLAIHAGEDYVPPGLAARLLCAKKANANSSPKRTVDSLNIRDEQILSLLTRGMTNREIAAELRLSLNTVSRYVTNLLQKLNVRNRVEAAVAASQRSPEHVSGR